MTINKIIFNEDEVPKITPSNSSLADVNVVQNQLKIDEGDRLDVYYDDKGFLTVGIGHKALPGDNLKFKDVITVERKNQLFQQDFNDALNDSTKYIKNFSNYPKEAQEVIINMVFNMGITGVLRFKKFLAALDSKDYKLAAEEMKNSDWYGEVGDRAKRLIKIIQGLK